MERMGRGEEYMALHLQRGSSGMERCSGNCNVILYKIFPAGNQGEGSETYFSVLQT